MKLTVLATSDIHGYIWPDDDQSTALKPYGLLRVATYLKEKRASGDPLITIDNGDLLQGAPYTSYLMGHRDQWDTHPVVTCMNTLGYDAGVPGNHEFNYGMDYLQNCVSKLQYPYIAANVIGKDKSTIWEPYTIIERAGVKVGIIGLTTSYIQRWERAEHIAGVRFSDPVECAQYWTEVIRGQVDVLILAYHGGIERDMQTGEYTEYQTGENVGYRLATEVKGIDALITGHQHRILFGKCGHIPYVQPGARGAYIGEFTFELEKVDQKWEIKDAESKLIETKDFKPDLELSKEMDRWFEEKEAWLDTPLYKLVAHIKKKDSTDSSKLIDFIHKVQTTSAGVDISFIQMFNNGERLSYQTLTMREVIKIYPFPNTFAVMRVYGHELKSGIQRYVNLLQNRYLEQKDVVLKIKDDLELIFSRCTYTLEITNDHRIFVTNLYYKDQEVVDEAQLEIIVNQYRTQIDDIGPLFPAETIIQEMMIPMVDIITNYLYKGEVSILATKQGFKTIQ